MATQRGLFASSATTSGDQKETSIPDSEHWKKWAAKLAEFDELKIEVSDEKDKTNFERMHDTFKQALEIGKKTVGANPVSIAYYSDQASRLARNAYGVDETGHSNIPPFSGRKSYAFIAAIYDPFFDDSKHVKVSTWKFAQAEVDKVVAKKQIEYGLKSNRLKEAIQKFKADEKNSAIIKEADALIAKMMPAATVSATVSESLSVSDVAQSVAKIVLT